MNGILNGGRSMVQWLGSVFGTADPARGTNAIFDRIDTAVSAMPGGRSTRPAISGLTRAEGTPPGIMPDRRIAGSPDRRIAGSPDRRIAGSPDRRIAGSPDRRIAGSPDRRIAGSPDPASSWWRRLRRSASRPESSSASARGRSDTRRPASSPDSFAPSPARAAAGARAARNPRLGLLSALLCLPLFLGFAAGQAQAQTTTLSISAPADANEGDSSTRDLTFTVTRTGGTANANYRVCFTGTATIDTTAGGTIPDAADYQPLTIVSGTGFPAGSNCLTGQTAGTGSEGIRVKGDTDAEVDETVIATLSLRGSNPGVTLGTSTATHTILDDDTPTPEISVSLPISEGESRSDAGEKKVAESEGSVGIGFNLAADQPLPSALTVCVRVTESGGDRVASGNEGIQTVSMPSSGLTNGSGTHTLRWTNTAADDQDSSVTVEVVAPNTASCSATNGSYTVSSSAASDKLLIQDDEDTTVSLTSTDMTMTEGDASDTATLTVSLDRRLYAGETIGVPIALASDHRGAAAGERGRQHRQPRFTVAAAAASMHSGVTLANALTANPRVVFTGHDSNTVQTATVTLTPVANRDDGDAAHETITATLSHARPAGHDGERRRAAHATNNAATLTLEDDEAVPAGTPGITLSKASPLRLLETGSTTYTVVLDAAPTADVRVIISPSSGGLPNGDVGAAGRSPTELTFTTSNWSQPQTVTVTGSDESGTHRNRALWLTHGVLSTDTRYGDLPNTSLRVNVDDAPEVEAYWYIKGGAGGARIRRPHTITSTRGLTAWQNAAPGDRISYAVRLSNRPAPGGTVTVTATVPSDKRNLVGLSLTEGGEPENSVRVEFKDRSPGAGTGCSNWFGHQPHQYFDSHGNTRTVSGRQPSESYDGTADTPWECWRMIYVVRLPASRHRRHLRRHHPHRHRRRRAQGHGRYDPRPCKEPGAQQTGVKRLQ